MQLHTSSTSADNSRDTCADFVRIVAMLMICILHIAYLSGVRFLDYNTDYTARIISNAWMAICIIAVNLYALLSGYLCINRHWNIQRYIELWITVCFYTFILYIPGIIREDTLPSIRSLFFINPFTSCYWYFSAYSGLFIAIPFLNKGLNSLSKRDYKILTILLLLSFSVLGCWKPNQMAQNGYNAIWLIILYITGGYIKLHRPAPPTRLLIAASITGILANFALEFFPGPITANLLWSYASIFTLLASLAVFLLSFRIKFQSTLLIGGLKRAAPTAFAVYLIHCHPYIWTQLKSILPPLALHFGNSWWFLPLGGLLLYVLGSLTDWMRIYLFKALRIKKAAILLSKFIPQSIRDLDQSSDRRN